MKKCSYCKTNNADENKFCTSCGKKLSGLVICPYCKNGISPADKFCTHCGKDLTGDLQKKPEKKRLSKLKKSFIGLGAFFGFLAVAYFALFFVGRFYLFEKYTVQYQEDGSKRIIEKESLSEVSFTELTICDQIDTSTYSPISSSNQFDMGFRELYATINVNGITENDNYNFKWIREDTGEELIDFKSDYFTGEGYFSGNVYFPLVISPDDNINGYQIFNQPGRYRVEFYNNNKLINSAPFEVAAPEVLSDKQVVFKTFDKETLEPFKARSNFKVEAEQLLSGVRLSGRIQKEDSFSFTLENKSTGEVLKKYEGKYSDLTGEDYFEDFIYFYIKGPFSDEEIILDPGDYNVDFYHNRELKSSTTFKIDPQEKTFGDLILSKDTGADYSPVDPTDSFILGTRKICAAVYVSDADSDDTWKFIWSTKNKDRIIKEFEDTYDVEEDGHFSGYQAVNLYVPGDQKIEGIDIFGYPGEYLVEFYHNNELISSKVFELVDTGVTFEELIICEDADENNLPINQASKFPYLGKSIYATINILRADLEDECRFIIKRKDSNEIIRDFVYKYGDNWNKGGDTYNGHFALDLESAEYVRGTGEKLSYNPGNYVIEFYHNGFLVESSSFEITRCIKEQEEKLTVRLFEMIETVVWPGQGLDRTTEKPVRSGNISGVAHTLENTFRSPEMALVSDEPAEQNMFVETLRVENGPEQPENRLDMVKIVGISPAADVEEIILISEGSVDSNLAEPVITESEEDIIEPEETEDIDREREINRPGGTVTLECTADYAPFILVLDLDTGKVRGSYDYSHEGTTYSGDIDGTIDLETLEIKATASGTVVYGESELEGGGNIEGFLNEDHDYASGTLETEGNVWEWEGYRESYKADEEIGPPEEAEETQPSTGEGLSGAVTLNGYYSSATFTMIIDFDTGKVSGNYQDIYDDGSSAAGIIDGTIDLNTLEISATTPGTYTDPEGNAMEAYPAPMVGKYDKSTNTASGTLTSAHGTVFDWYAE